MTTEEMIAVMQAQLAGKQIQVRRLNYSDSRDANWFTLGEVVWDFHEFEYRIKPREPREFWIDLDTESGFGAVANRKQVIGKNVIHVREVL